jgi:hypothetical protein
VPPLLLGISRATRRRDDDDEGGEG